ncbi:MAG: RimK family protein [Rhodospirillales bacterium]
MPKTVIIVDQLQDFVWESGAFTVMDVQAYITAEPGSFGRNTRVINLADSYVYLGYGYYCSLLAEARSHRVIPSVSTIQDLARRGRNRTTIRALEETLTATLKRLRDEPDGAFSLDVFLGRTEDGRFSRLAAAAYEAFRTPGLRLRIDRAHKAEEEKGAWVIKSIRPIAPTRLSGGAMDAFGAALADYAKVGWATDRPKKLPRYTFAVLLDPREHMPPSDEKAIARFTRAADRRGIAVERIGKKDFSRLGEFDALFIRETTEIDHHTFRFAQKAEEEGLAVIDDVTSILRCTNKVYLAEAMAANNVPTPRTKILGRFGLRHLDKEIGYPIVLKVPDGSFSRGVFKVDNPAELVATTRKLFKDSDILIAQAFMYTPHDWRVGVLDGEPLFVCQYAMAAKHWQIYKHESGGSFRWGRYKTFAIDEAPPAVIDIAVRAARVVGTGLYGVDLKETEDGAVYVIEVNDNPSIESGVEDAVLKDALYDKIVDSLVARIGRLRDT